MNLRSDFGAGDYNDVAILEALLKNGKHQNEKKPRIGDEEYGQLGLFDKPLPCCGCGIGWFCFLLGFLFPLLWYYCTILYLGNYYLKDPRERTGLAANAIAALIVTVAVLITLAAMFL